MAAEALQKQRRLPLVVAVMLKRLCMYTILAVSIFLFKAYKRDVSAVCRGRKFEEACILADSCIPVYELRRTAPAIYDRTLNRVKLA